MSAASPLHGVRILTLAVNLPGPLAAARLAALGAEVTKVEPPAGDPLAGVTPAWYRRLIEGQTVVSRDLKEPAGRDWFHAALAATDLLITAMRPSAAERLGLGEQLEQRPRLSWIEIVGHDGVHAERPGHDLNYQADHGTLTPPTMPTVPIADVLGAERAVTEALLALRVRDATGSGQLRRIVLEEAAAAAGDAVRYGLLGEGAPLGGADPAYGIYATADGHVAVGAVEPHFRARLNAALQAATGEELRAAFAARPNAHWVALGEREDIPVTAIRHQQKEETA